MWRRFGQRRAPAVDLACAAGLPGRGGRSGGETLRIAVWSAPDSDMARQMTGASAGARAALALSVGPTISLHEVANRSNLLDRRVEMTK